MKRNIKQGEIYMVNLGENNVGSEEKGVRPCVIISAEMLNKNRNNVIVIPIKFFYKTIPNIICKFFPNKLVKQIIRSGFSSFSY